MRKLLITFSLAIFWVGVNAQAINDIRINEMLVVNQDNYEDDYGHREPWVELYNSSHSSVDVGGCYFSAEPGNPELTYRIPTGDRRTLIPPQGYLVFFFEGTQTKGTFHSSFTLDQKGRLAFINANGKEIIDEIHYDIDEQRADVSMGLITNEEEVLVFTYLDTTTPYSTNEMPIEVPKHEQFRRMDPSGAVLAITAVLVVFTALFLLWMLFGALGRIMVSIARRKDAVSKDATATTKTDAENMYSGEVVAAISMAFKLYKDDLHDRESTMLTINKVNKFYSPWSSKIYGLRRMPERKK